MPDAPLATIDLSAHHTVQGEVIRHCDDGRVVVRCNGQDWAGRPVGMEEKNDDL